VLVLVLYLRGLALALELVLEGLVLGSQFLVQLREDCRPCRTW
jgi:hypothetical protein